MQRGTKAAVVLHEDCEPLGHFQRWLPAAGLELELFRVHAGDTLPTDLADFAAVIVMGGPQAVYVDGAIAEAETSLVRQCLAEGLPFLGVCLGAQLLAQVAGGEVARGEHGDERGACTITVEPAAADDALFAMIPIGEHTVVQWHGDAITALPDGALLLASSKAYPVQAFRVGAGAWGVQFHPEADAAIVHGWAEQDGVDPSAYVPGVEDVDTSRWESLVSAFARLAVGAVTTGGG